MNIQIRPDHPAELGSKGGVVQKPRTEATRVLVVDDEALIRWSVTERLQVDGHAIVSAATLGAARNALSQSTFSAIVLDIRLPDGDGIELLRRVRKELPAVPVIMISAHGDAKTAATVRALGAVAFLSKPFDLDALAVTVAEALANAARAGAEA